MIRFFVLLFALWIIILSRPTLPVPPPSRPAFIVPSLSSSPSHQLNKIVDALAGAGDFAVWANILSSIDPSTLPINATFFIPTDHAVEKIANSILPDTFFIPYHIVPERLSFDDLRKYPVSTKLPTLLPTSFIVVTNDSVENYSVDGMKISHPDLYLSGSFAVHGVMNVLAYPVFGNGVETANGTLAKTERKNGAKEKAVEVSFGERKGSEERLRRVALICVAVSLLFSTLFWCMVWHFRSRILTRIGYEQ